VRMDNTHCDAGTLDGAFSTLRSRGQLPSLDGSQLEL